MLGTGDRVPFRSWCPAASRSARAAYGSDVEVGRVDASADFRETWHAGTLAPADGAARSAVGWRRRTVGRRVSRHAADGRHETHS
ncbi:MAG: hypothetical protein HC834_06690 [Rhodospirillales bacterium]|nr:hypothetical protein [Rhodospirillales bacterium]